MSTVLDAEPVVVEIEEDQAERCCWLDGACPAEPKWRATWRCGCILDYCHRHHRSIIRWDDIACSEPGHLPSIAPADWKRI